MFYFGVDYYPEHWPEERWPVDAKMMAEAGFNVVRMAEFAWSMLEPEEGRFEFDWLDRAIAILAEQGIQVVLGTPTASPPPWLMHAHPDAYRVLADGRRMTYGNRREYCPNNPAYRHYSQRITEAMAAHYAGHPNVIGWQIDNEFGDPCYCPVCRVGFQNWLRDRYGSLEALNRRWGTVFWSHVYNDWAEIPLPLETGGAPRSGLALDFKRFASDSYVDYQQLQVDILRQYCPEHFITHNFMGFGYDQLNYFDLARALDLVSWDNYPRGFWDMKVEVDPSVPALGHDAMRGLKRRNFWIMEQQAGPTGWDIIGETPRPGELRLWAWQAIAHGADGVVFFRWRTCAVGEQFWHGVLDHHGQPGRRYEELAGMGAELQRAGQEIAGAEWRAETAMLLSYDSRFAFQIQPNNPGFNFTAHFQQFYRALHRRNVSIDIVAPDADLSPYRLLVAPALYVLPPALADNLRRYVEEGGVLLLTARSGVKDEANAVVETPLPGLLSDLCGVVVEEYDSLPPGVSQPLAFDPPDLRGDPPARALHWCDILALTSARTLARYTEDYYAGRPAITINRFGKGQVIYMGAFGDETLSQRMMDWLLDLAKVRPLVASPPGVEISERWQDGRRLLFVLNHTGREQEVRLGVDFTNLLDGSSIPDPANIPPRGVWVLQQSP